MGFYEKILGMCVVPLLYILLVLLAIGLARKQMHAIVRLLLSFNFTINGRTIFLFPFIAAVNMVAILFLYYQLSEMQEPIEMQQRTQYYERLYRTYRNFLINIVSVVLILEIFISGRRYHKYEVIRDELIVAQNKQKAK